MTNMFPPPANFSFPPGCPPPGCFDPNALLQCYGDIQALTALVTQIVQNLATTDPAFIQSIIDGIIKSGSNLPLIGVTNGTDAQPGQVGEWVRITQDVPIPVGNSPNISFSMTILQPGDWDIWGYLQPNTTVDWIAYYINPTPPGFTGNITAYLSSGAEASILVTSTERALISVPTLVPMTIQCSNAGAATTASANFMARRRR